MSSNTLCLTIYGKWGITTAVTLLRVIILFMNLCGQYLSAMYARAYLASFALVQAIAMDATVRKRPLEASTTPQRPRKLRKLVPVRDITKGNEFQIAHFKLKGSPKRKAYKPRKIPFGKLLYNFQYFCND